MNAVRVPRWYELTLRLYPASFRDEFGDDMRLLFNDIAARESGWKLIGRITRDVAVSVPRVARQENSMKGKATIFLTIALVLGLAVAGTGSPLLGGALTLAGTGIIFGSAALIARRGGPTTESVYRRRYPAWIIAAGFVGLYAIVSMTEQFVGEPTRNNFMALLFGLSIPAMITGGFLARVAGRRWGHWLIAVACIPMLAVFWFPPAPIASLVAIVGGLAEWMRGRRPAPSPAV